jgi:hypothetical protein
MTGTEIGAGTLYKGIIVYMLVINPSDNYLTEKISATWGTSYSYTVEMDGTITPEAGYRPTVAGPVNFVRISPADPSQVIIVIRRLLMLGLLMPSVIFKPYHVLYLVRRPRQPELCADKDLRPEPYSRY